MIVNIATSERELGAAPLSEIVCHMGERMAQFDSQSLAAHLHDNAYDDTRQRIWQAFLGRHHLLMTSWVHTRLYNVQFGMPEAPFFVDAVVPKLDSCIQVMELTKVRTSCGDGGDVKSAESIGPKTAWMSLSTFEKKIWRDCSTVRICMDSDCLERKVELRLGSIDELLMIHDDFGSTPASNVVVHRGGGMLFRVIINMETILIQGT